METVWFWLIGFMLATYVVLDGFDLGTGVLHLIVGRTEEERNRIIHSIGPVWDGNEVWLIASGGALVLAFPTLYAVTFSGFYLPLMIVLWLLMGRALGIEMRHHLTDSMWNQFWDVIFAVSSSLLVIFFGAALGNIVRGVPLKEDGRFFEPLWTNFRIGPDTGILDWYTILVGITAFVALTYHAALWLSWQTDQSVKERSMQAARVLFIPLLITWLLTIAASSMVQPLLKQNLELRPWGVVFLFLTLPALVFSLLLHKRQLFRGAFFASCGMLYSMVLSAAAGLYPYVLPARNPELGLTISQVASPQKSMTLALYWWIPGMLIAVAYAFFIYSRFLTSMERRHN